MNNYNQIDLDKVKEKVSSYAFIEDSKAFILNEDVPFNPLIIKRNINETNEILNLLKKDIYISFDGIHNINNLFEQSKKGIILNSKEISEILNFYNHIKRIKDIISKLDGELAIKDYTDSLYLNLNLEKEIIKVVDNYGNIKETASDKLKEIIKNIENNEKALNDRAHIFLNKHNSSLQEDSIYERNNRITFLIKNSDKNKYNGFIYGTSSSGLASYVEPEGFIELNNNRISLIEDKEEEIKRILTKLTFLVSNDANFYIDNFNAIVKLDVVYAKAMYGLKNNGILNNEFNDLYIKDVAHPLIDEKKVIVNTYSLKKPYKGIVISGTNTGGKTVGLKVIGLSILMSYLGIPVIASEISVPLYNGIYIDIDDNQSISNSLSTFSAHISNINSILSKADDKSLILIDELISGTDPKEAQAISLAILKKIEELNSAFVITTHYDEIKNYAYQNEEILLSAVGFDNEKLLPTYKYIENSIGASNALDIADRYFDDKSLIKYARQIVKENSSKEDTLLNKLALELEINEKLKDDLTIQIEKNKQIENELNEKKNDFEKEKINLKNQFQNELNEYIESIKLQAIEKLDSIKDKKEESIIKEIESLKQDEIKEIVTFEINDNVKVGTNDRIGKILSIDNNKVIVDINGISIKTTIDNLIKMPKTIKKEYKAKEYSNKSIKKEINLVGLHIEEGLELLEPFLDNALSCNLTSVKVIHGIGTGQLRKAVRERLKRLKFVKKFEDGDFYDGGSAVTIVYFK